MDRPNPLLNTGRPCLPHHAIEEEQCPTFTACPNRMRVGAPDGVKGSIGVAVHQVPSGWSAGALGTPVCAGDIMAHIAACAGRTVADAVVCLERIRIAAYVRWRISTRHRHAGADPGGTMVRRRACIPIVARDAIVERIGTGPLFAKASGCVATRWRAIAYDVVTRVGRTLSVQTTTRATGYDVARVDTQSLLADALLIVGSELVAVETNRRRWCCARHGCSETGAFTADFTGSVLDAVVVECARIAVVAKCTRDKRIDASIVDASSETRITIGRWCIAGAAPVSCVGRTSIRGIIM